MLDQVPLSLLRAFEAAGRTGSFRSAAVELSLTPSAVSHAIRKLESNIGIKLFFRSTRRIHLTPEGEFLYQHVSRGFKDLRYGIETVATRRHGTLRLHSAPSFAAQWLVPRLAHFLDTHPHIEILLAANTDYPTFETDEFDLDIVYGKPRNEGLTVIPLGEELLTPLCSPSMAQRVHCPADIAQLPLIQSEYKQFRWPSWFEANNLPIRTPRGARFDRSFLAIAAAADGLGVALESTRLAEREISSGRLVRPLARKEVELRYTAHYVAYSSALQQRHAIGVFCNWLTAELALPGGRPQNAAPSDPRTRLRVSRPS